MMDDTRNKIISRAKDSETQLGHYYNVIKDYAKQQRVFLDKVLEDVFKEFCQNHSLGEVNEQLKNKN